MKVKLIFRHNDADARGAHVGYKYVTEIVEIPPESPVWKLWNAKRRPPEIIGGEWLKEAPDGERTHAKNMAR